MEKKKYIYKINGRDYEVAIESVAGTSAEVTVNGTSYHVDKAASEADRESLEQKPVEESRSTAENRTAAPSSSLVSPLPGIILSVLVNPGDTIKAGQVVAVLEAMKMENEIQAEKDGVVASVHVKAGDSVLEGAAIVTIG